LRDVRGDQILRVETLPGTGKSSSSEKVPKSSEEVRILIIRNLLVES